MNKLFEMFDRYVDEKILAKTNELEGLQIRDANRIADLEDAHKIGQRGGPFYIITFLGDK